MKEEVIEEPRKVWAWTMYDWANSVFSLTITTAIFPPFYESVSKQAAIKYGTVVGEQHYLKFFGFDVLNSAAYSFTLSLGFFVVMLVSPLLSGIADAKSKKLFFLKLFCYLGAVACAGLYFMNADSIYYSLLMFMLGIIGFGGSIVFYNAFLPEITTEERFDRISARGFSMGYVGSVLLLLFNLSVLLMPDLYFDVADKVGVLMQQGMDENQAVQTAKDYYGNLAVKIAFISVAIWWVGFAQIPFYYLKEKAHKSIQSNATIMKQGIAELKKVWFEILHNEQSVVGRYLIGFFFTSMGLQTVMYVATLFGSQELKLKTENLIITVLIIQLLAIVGAWGFARISERIGNIYALLIMIVMWIGICFAAYGVQSAFGFYLLAVWVGFIMGGIQSMFRSTYAKIMPDNTPNTASYFSFFDICEKAGTVLGTFSFGLLLNITGNMRGSIIALALYFVVGLFFIARIKNFKVLRYSS
jgi:UMF1 family MFS transporter